MRTAIEIIGKAPKNMHGRVKGSTGTFLGPIKRPYMTFYNIVIVISALFVTICTIFSIKICTTLTLPKKFNLESEVPGQRDEKQDLCHSVGNIQIYTGDFSELLATPQHRLHKT